MMQLLASFALSVSVIFAFPELAAAHSGGTDRYGYHAGSRPYHCHGGGTSSGSRYLVFM